MARRSQARTQSPRCFSAQSPKTLERRLKLWTPKTAYSTISLTPKREEAPIYEHGKSSAIQPSYWSVHPDARYDSEELGHGGTEKLAWEDAACYLRSQARMPWLRFSAGRWRRIRSWAARDRRPNGLNSSGTLGSPARIRMSRQPKCHSTACSRVSSGASIARKRESG